MKLTQNTEKTANKNSAETFNPTDLLRQRKQNELHKLFNVWAPNWKTRVN